MKIFVRRQIEMKEMRDNKIELLSESIISNNKDSDVNNNDNNDQDKD
jgi:hypothetical protein